MKKIIALLLVILMIFALAACAGEETDEEEKDDKPIKTESSVTTSVGTFEYGTNEEGDYEITKYVPASLKVVDVTLPKETADGRDIVGVGKEAFKAVLSVKSVTIPNTYVYVADYAFYGCDELAKVSMSDSVETIGKGAFQNCPKLAELTLSKGIKTVSVDAFNGCEKITAVDLSACETLEKGAFFGCTALTDVTLSDKLTYVSAYAFTGADNVVYTVENGAKYLGNKENPYVALICASSLDIETCTVNDSTTIIAERAFAYCSDLETVTLGKAVTVINGSCFENDPEYDKKFGDAEIPQVKLTFNTYDEDTAGCYLGTEENPYMVLVYIIATNADDFKLHADTKIIADTAFEDSKIKDIAFDGTEEDWNAIIKGENWADDRIINVLWNEPVVEE